MASEYIPVALRQLVFDRARGMCEYCRSQAKYAIDPLDLLLYKPQKAMKPICHKPFSDFCGLEVVALTK